MTAGKKGGLVQLDRDPTPEEEFEYAFAGENKKTLELQNKLREQELAQREEYAQRAYGLTQTWVGFIIVITLTQMTLSVLELGRLEPSEFIAVLTSTTVAILGFWALVGRGLFRVMPTQDNETKKKAD